MPSRTAADPDAYGVRIFGVARWNALWESAQFRRPFFHDGTDSDNRLPADPARIVEIGDRNRVFIPRTETATTTMRRRPPAPRRDSRPIRAANAARRAVAVLGGADEPRTRVCRQISPIVCRGPEVPRCGDIYCPVRRRAGSPPMTRFGSWLTTSTSGSPLSRRLGRMKCGHGASSTAESSPAQ